MMRWVSGEIIARFCCLGIGVRLAILLRWLVKLVMNGGQSVAGGELGVEHCVTAGPGEGENVF